MRGCAVKRGPFTLPKSYRRTIKTEWNIHVMNHVVVPRNSYLPVLYAWNTPPFDLLPLQSAIPLWWQLLGSHLEFPPRYAYFRATCLDDIGIMIFVLQ